MAFVNELWQEEVDQLKAKIKELEAELARRPSSENRAVIDYNTIRENMEYERLEHDIQIKTLEKQIETAREVSSAYDRQFSQGIFLTNDEYIENVREKRWLIETAMKRKITRDYTDDDRKLVQLKIRYQKID